MVYNTQNYWVYGVCPSFNILKTRERFRKDPGSKMCCSLVFRIPDDRQNPKTQ
jgi:hypothetical protein